MCLPRCTFVQWNMGSWISTWMHANLSKKMFITDSYISWFTATYNNMNTRLFSCVFWMVNSHDWPLKPYILSGFELFWFAIQIMIWPKMFQNIWFKNEHSPTRPTLTILTQTVYRPPQSNWIFNYQFFQLQDNIIKPLICTIIFCITLQIFRFQNDVTIFIQPST